MLESALKGNGYFKHTLEKEWRGTVRISLVTDEVWMSEFKNIFKNHYNYEGTFIARKLMGISVATGHYKGTKRDFFNDVLVELANLFDT